MRLVKTDTPQVRAFETAVEVPADFSGEGGQFTWKLAVDNITKQTPTAGERSDALDDCFPQRNKKRALIAALNDIIGDVLLAPKLRLLCDKIKDYFGAQMPGEDGG